MNFLCLVFTIVIIFILAEVLYRKGLKAEYTRKIIHVCVGVIIAFFPYFISYQITMIFGLITSILIILFYNKKILNSVFDIGRESIGARLYVPSLMLVAVTTWKTPLLYTMIVLIMVISDGLAGVIGELYGKKYIYKNKTIEGSFIFFLSTFLILSYFLINFNYLELNIVSIIKITIIVLITTIIELISTKGIDNITITIFLLFMVYFRVWI